MAKDKFTTQADSKHTEYSLWNMMHQRTGSPNNKRYADYGGRGITVCERWHNFRNFVTDMGPRPSKDHSIDRIDNAGNYEPSNCRWATRNEQALNTRRNRILTANGESMCIAEWSRKTGIPSKMISSRLGRGWTEEQAVTTPPLDADSAIKVARARREAIFLERQARRQTGGK